MKIPRTSLGPEQLEPRVVFAAGDLDFGFSGDGTATAAFRTASFLDAANDAALQADGKIVLVGFGDASGGRYFPDFVVGRLNADGTPDLSFGDGGQVVVGFDGAFLSQELANAVTIQPDGKIVVAGRAQLGNGFDFAVARFNSDGTLDNTFGTGGKVVVDSGGNDEIFDVAIDGSGRVVAAGRAGSQFALLRFTTLGVPDSTLDSDGLLLGTFDGFDGARALLIEPGTGKLIVGGSDGTDFVMARYSSNGVLDPTFDTDGVVVTDFGPTAQNPNVDRADFIHGLARQADGKIVAVGNSASDLALARFNLDGSLDTTFDTDGRAAVVFSGGSADLHAVAIQASGAIVATGRAVGGTSPQGLYAFRFTSAGAVDTTFGGGDGRVDVPLGAGVQTGNALLIDSAGKLVIAGAKENDSGRIKDSVVVRLDGATGTPDATFSGDGVAVVDFLGSFTSRATVVLVQPNGKVLIGGQASVLPFEADTDFALMRFNGDGTFDATFGVNGRVVTGFAPGMKDEIQALALAPDGRIYAAGQTNTFGDFAIARYNADGTLDSSYGNGGKVVGSFTNGGRESATALALDANGKLLVGGSAATGLAQGEFFVARYNVDGTLDPSFGNAGRAEAGSPEPSSVASIAVQSTGRIVFGLTTDPVEVRGLTSAGVLDSTFDSDGIALVSLPGENDLLSELLVLPDDTLVGLAKTTGGTKLFKLSAAGSLVNGFGSGGVANVLASGGNFSLDLARQADGKLIVGTGDSDHRLVTTRFNTDGTLDTSWGVGGVALSAAAGGSMRPIGIAIDSASGRLVAGATITVENVEQFGVIRLEKDLVPPPQGALRFSNFNYGALENAGTVTITVQRVGGATGAVSVNYSAEGGSATAGLDFTAASGTLNFANNETSKTFTISILTDAIEEGQETILLDLSSPTGGASIDNPHHATLFIAGEPTEAGLIDPSFGTEGFGIGKTRTKDPFFNDDAAAIARQPDGKLVVFSSSEVSTSGTDWLIERFNADGTLDTGFGIGGSVLTDFFNTFDFARSVSILPDGKILAVGRVGVNDTGSIGMARYNPDGTLDTTFGEQGKVARTARFDNVWGSEVLADGKIVVGGEMEFENGPVQPAVARFNADGTVDSTFGTNGVFTFAVKGGDYRDDTFGFTAQPDGKLIVVGSTGRNSINGDEDAFVARINTNGTLDTGFGTQGKIVVDFSGNDDAAHSVQVQPDGKIVVAGVANKKTFVARFLSNGATDTNFDGADGVITLSFPANPTNSSGRALAIQQDGKIVVGAVLSAFENGVGVARLNPDGTLNTSFGLNGYTEIPNEQDEINLGSLLVQPDGKVLVSGRSLDVNSESHIYVARLLADPLKGAFQFSNATYSIDENAGVATITVERIGGADGAVTVNFASSNGTALAGSDYFATSGTLTFADQEVLKTFTVPLIDNNAVEGKESLTFTLGAPSGGATLAARTTTTLTIFDGPGAIEFGQPEFFAGEKFGTTVIVINRTGGSDGTVSAQFSTSDQTATSGSDYTAVTQMITFLDGETTKTVAIPVLNDSALEGLERVNLALTSPTGGATLGLRATAPLLLFDQEGGTANNPGAPDPDWGGDGFVETTFHTGNGFTQGFATDLLVQPDGRVVVAGTVDVDGNASVESADFALVRYLPDGSLDLSFGGGDGKVTLDLGGFEQVARLLQGPGGKLLIVGSTLRDGKSDFVLARFNADGTLDSTFDHDGFLTTDFGQRDDRAGGAGIDPQGRIVVVGSSGTIFSRDFAIARYSAEGVLDATFSGDGKLLVDFSARLDLAKDVAFFADGDLIIVGSSQGEDSGHFGNSAWALTRLNENGTLEPTFGTGGTTLLDTRTTTEDHLARVMVLPDGRFITGGDVDGVFVVTRWSGAGVLDKTFGTSLFGEQIDFNGTSSSSFLDADLLHDLVLQPDGKILAAGSWGSRFVVLRLDSDGFLDPYFGAHGTFVTTVKGGARAAEFHDGRIYLAGGAENGSAFTVGRLLAEQASPIGGSFNFVTQFPTISESAGAAKIAVTRPNYAAFGTVSVNYVVTGISATPGSDFTQVAGVLTFLDGETSKTFDIPIFDDGVIDPGERIGMYLFNPTGDSELGSIASSSLTIIDNDDQQRGQFQLSPTSFVSTENGGSRTITVLRGGGTNGTVTVQYATIDGTAKAGQDFTFTAGTLTFANGESSKTFSIPIIDDLAIEGDETFSIELFNPTNGSRINSFAGRTALFTIIDFEQLTVNNAGELDSTFSTDGKETATFSPAAGGIAAFVRDPATDKIIAVGSSSAGSTGRWALARFNADGTLDATFGTAGKVLFDVRNYTDTALDVFLTPGGKILVAGTSESDSNTGLAFARFNADGTVDTSFGTGGTTVLPYPSYRGALTEFAVQPDGKIIAAGTAWNGEDSDLAVVRLTASGHLDTSFGIGGEFYYDSFGTDTLPSILVEANGKILLGAGFNVGLVRLDANGTLDQTFGAGGFFTGPGAQKAPVDMIRQPDGKLLLLHSETITTPSFRTVAAVTRLNADFSLDTTFDGDGTSTIDFRVSTTPAKITVVSSGDAAGRIIVAGAAGGDFALARLYPDGVHDYGFGSEGLVLTNFSTSSDRASDVEVLPDGKVLAGGAASAFALARYVGGISRGELRMGAPTYQVIEDGTSLSVTVHRIGGMDGAVSVSYATANGTAIAGTDFGSLSGTLNWADRDRAPKTITIPITNDTINQGNLNFTFALSSPGGGAALNAVSTSTITILEDEIPGRLGLVSPFFQVSEDGTNASITVVRTNGKGGPVSATLSATGSSATAGVDFTFAPLVVNFADQETSKTITIPITNDTLVEGSEFFLVSLSAATGGATLGPYTSGEVLINDNDLPNPGVVGFVSAELFALESDGYVTLAVRRTGGNDGDLNVNVAITGGTARAGFDHAGDATLDLVIPAGQNSVTFTLPVIDDTVGESDETVQFTLTTSTVGATLGAKSTATVTILDNDSNAPAAASVFAFSTPTFHVNEAQAFATLVVTRSGGTGAGSVTLQTNDGTALAGLDFIATTLVIDFAAGEGQKSVTVPLRRDFLSETSESFTATLTAPVGGDLGVQTSALVTILDDDPHSLPDIDGDGDFDLVLKKGAKFYLHLNPGNGVFSALNPKIPGDAAKIIGTVKAPSSFIFGDFDGDGNDDLAVLSIAKKNISLLLGNDDGTLDAPIAFASGPLTGRAIKTPGKSGLLAADFNGDGRLDLAAVSAKGVNVLLNTGSPGAVSFTTAVQAVTGKGFSTLLSGDFNEDGKVDLAAFKAGAKPTVNIFEGTGGGAFAPTAIVSKMPKSMKGIQVADVTGDGHLDFTAIFPKNNLGFIVGNGSSTYGPPITDKPTPLPTKLLPTDKGPLVYGFSDFDDDLDLDLVAFTAKKLASIIVNNNPLFSRQSPSLATLFNPSGVALADINGDNDPDLVLFDKADRFKVLLGGAAASFHPA